MSLLEDILARYPQDEVKAALPVIYFSAAPADSDEVTRELRMKIVQASRVLGIRAGMSAQEIAAAIAAYCVKQSVNSSLLVEVASTYQAGRTADILKQVAIELDAAKKLLGDNSVISAPRETQRPVATVKPKRGLSR